MVVAVLVAAGLGWVWGERQDSLAGGYGLISLAPAAIAISLAFLTREVIIALILAIFAGGAISGEANIIQKFLVPAVGSPQFGLILLVYLWCLGGLIGIWTRTGGAQAFAVWTERRLVTGSRSAKLFAWLMGIVFHQGGIISTVLAGTTVRPVTDRHRISHEELSYIVDSTASPVAGIIPLNVWPIYVSGLVVGTVPLLPDQSSAISFFYRSIPLNFYGMFAVLMTLLLSLEVLPWTGGKMARAIERARRTGQLDSPQSTPLLATELTAVNVPDGYRPSPVDFLVPILTLIGFALGSYLVAGSVMIGEAFGLAVLVGSLLVLLRGLKVGELVGGFVDGCKGVTNGAIILALAVTLSRVSQELGTATYIVETTSRWVVPLLLPAMLLAMCMVVSFSIGTSFGTFAVIFPLAMPLAWSAVPDADYLSLCFATVVGGSMFGDQCSPISDTTILSSLACGADLMDHVTTQLPLAMAAACLAALASVLAASLIL